MRRAKRIRPQLWWVRVYKLTGNFPYAFYKSRKEAQEAMANFDPSYRKLFRVARIMIKEH